MSRRVLRSACAGCVPGVRHFRFRPRAWRTAGLALQQVRGDVVAGVGIPVRKNWGKIRRRRRRRRLRPVVYDTIRNLRRRYYNITMIIITTMMMVIITTRTTTIYFIIIAIYYNNNILYEYGETAHVFSCIIFFKKFLTKISRTKKQQWSYNIFCVWCELVFYFK